jgi:hypothetical protein
LISLLRLLRRISRGSSSKQRRIPSVLRVIFLACLAVHLRQGVQPRDISVSAWNALYSNNSTRRICASKKSVRGLLALGPDIGNMNESFARIVA